MCVFGGGGGGGKVKCFFVFLKKTKLAKTGLTDGVQDRADVALQHPQARKEDTHNNTKLHAVK